MFGYEYRKRYTGEKHNTMRAFPSKNLGATILYKKVFDYDGQAYNYIKKVVANNNVKRWDISHSFNEPGVFLTYEIRKGGF